MHANSQQCASCNLQNLTLLVSLPMPNRLSLFDPSWNGGNRVLPALYLARDQINNRTDLLPCYKLELVTVDGGCDISATTAVSTVAGILNENNTTVVGIVGPGCSASALQTATFVNESRIELVHIHGGGSPILANRSRYNNSLGILGSTQSFVDLSIALMKKNKWRNIAILFESNRVYYRSTKDEFIKAVNSRNVTVRFLSPVYSFFYPLDGIRNSLSRIVFVFTALTHLRRILCLAYHEGLVYPAYQWVIFGHQLSDIIDEKMSFTYDKQEYSCPLGAMKDAALRATFLINYQLFSNGSAKFANTTFDEFLSLYSERAAHYHVATTNWSYYYYDAVWAWAYVLHRLTVKNSKLFSDFQYGNETMAKLILEEFYASDFEFEGMSGRISFNPSNGFVNRSFYLYQIDADGNEIRIGDGNANDIKPIDGLVISDIVRADTPVSRVLIVFFLLLHFMLFFTILLLHVLTTVYRNTKSVKASSPKISHFAFSGAYLLLFGLILFLVFEVKEHSANAREPICHILWAWLLPIGLTLIIGTVIVRTWRLYRIFIHYLDPGKLISNPALVIMLLIMLSVDIIIAVVWTSVDQTQLMITDTIENGQARETVVIRTCPSKNDLNWLSLIMAYKVAQLVVMIVLAFLTQNIPKTFATTTLQVFSYVYSTVFGIGFVLYGFFLFFGDTSYRLNSDIDYGILYTVLSIMEILFIVCVFSPPLMPVLRNKVGIKFQKIYVLCYINRKHNSRLM